MFLIKKPSMLDTLAQGAMGHHPTQERLNVQSYEPDSLEKIAENADTKLW